MSKPHTISRLLLCLDAASAGFPNLRRQLNQWNTTTDAWDYCQNAERFITMEFSNQNSGGSGCSCGVNDQDHGLGFNIQCTMLTDSCYVLQGTYEPGPRVSTLFSSKIDADGKESFIKCIDIKDYHSMDARVPKETNIEICIEASTTTAAHDNATCSASIGGVTCNSCEVIPCLYFSRPEFLLDCSNSRASSGLAGTVDTCRKTGMTGTPFIFWEPERYGVDSDNNGPFFGSCSSGVTFHLGTAMALLLMLFVDSFF